MPHSGEKQLRLVIQSVPGSERLPSFYRLILYPEWKGARRPLVFVARDELLQRLAAVIPHFDCTRVGQPGSSTRIVFAETLALTEAQLARLYGEE